MLKEPRKTLAQRELVRKRLPRKVEREDPTRKPLSLTLKLLKFKLQDQPKLHLLRKPAPRKEAPRKQERSTEQERLQPSEKIIIDTNILYCVFNFYF